MNLMYFAVRKELDHGMRRNNPVKNMNQLWTFEKKRIYEIMNRKQY